MNLKTPFNIQLLKKSPTFVHGHTGSASGGPFGNYRATVLASGLLRRPPDMAFQILQDLGPVMHINSTLEPQWNQVWKFFGGCFSNRYRMRSVELSLKGVLALASAVNTVFDTRGLNSLRLNEGIPVACVRNCGKSKGKQRREKPNRRQSVTLYQAWTCPTLVVPEPRERFVPSAALFAVHEEPCLARLTPL